MCNRKGCSKRRHNRRRDCDCGCGCDKNCEREESCAEKCGKCCCKPIKVAFIDQAGREGAGALEDTAEKIQEAFDKRLFPSIKEINISYVTPLESDASNLDVVMNELEMRVNDLKAMGFEYIVLPLSSSVLNPFIDPLNPINAALPPNPLTLDIMERHPTVTFVELNVGTDIVRSVPIPNVWKLFDTISGTTNADLQQNIQNWIQPGGQILFVGVFGSAASQTIISQYTNAANTLSVPTTIFNYNLPIDAPQTTMLVNIVNALPAGSTVLIALDGTGNATDDFTQEFFNNQWGSVNPLAQSFVYAGINYVPFNIVAPVDIQQPRIGQTSFWPSKFLIQQLGWPSILSDIAAFTPDFLYIEAMAFFGRCGKSYTGTDGYTKFDAFHALIAPFLAGGFVMAGTNVVTNTSVEENPRWTAASYHLQSNVCYT